MATNLAIVIGQEAYEKDYVRYEVTQSVVVLYVVKVVLAVVVENYVVVVVVVELEDQAEHANF